MNLEYFGLFNERRPMRVSVNFFMDDAVDIGLKDRVVKAMMKSRLRAANLLATPAKGMAPFHLYAAIALEGPSYSIDLKFLKWVTDDFGNRGLAGTWSICAIGELGRDHKEIMATLEQMVRKFVADFQRVNKKAAD